MSAIHCDVKIGQKPIVYSIYPAVYRQILSFGPGFLDYVAAGDIGDLLNHIEFTETVKLLLVIEMFKLLMVQAVDIPEMPQPVVDKSESVGTHGRPDAAAAVMAHHHDMFHLEDIDRILQNRQTVEICVDHHVGDIAMYKYFPRHQIYDLVGGTRLSEQPIQRYSGFCCLASCSKNCGFSVLILAAQRRLFSKSGFSIFIQAHKIAYGNTTVSGLFPAVYQKIKPRWSIHRGRISVMLFKKRQQGLVDKIALFQHRNMAGCRYLHHLGAVYGIDHQKGFQHSARRVFYS